jgi:hypothetical protein
MNSIMIRQIVVVSALVAILCIAFLTAMLLMLGNIPGAHASQSGIMLIAPSYIAPTHQFVD